MKGFSVSAAAFIFALTGVAHASDTTLTKAIKVYNTLPSKTRTLAISSTVEQQWDRTTRLPDWLNRANLSNKEAAATVAAFGVYGENYRVNYQTRKWGTGAKVVGAVADSTIFNNSNSLPAAMPDEPPARELIELRRTRLLSTMKDLGTCSGALAAAVRKAVASRPADDATRLLIKAQRDLGASALPPDSSCLI